jgi:hypothetical protein
MGKCTPSLPKALWLTAACLDCSLATSDALLIAYRSRDTRALKRVLPIDTR